MQKEREKKNDPNKGKRERMGGNSILTRQIKGKMLVLSKVNQRYEKEGEERKLNRR